MSNASLELGGGKWAAKEGNLLGYASSTSSSKFVPREFTFTRGSDIAATRVNSSGLIEKYRENLLLQSNQFDTTWTLNSTSVTSGQSGYDGSSDAWLLNSTTTGFPRIEQLVSASGVSTFSVYAKPATDGFALIRTFGAEATAWFDLINGTITNASGAQYVSSKIQFVGNGWYRCSVTFNGSLTTARIYPASAYGTYSTSGNGVYIQDTQIERGLVATSYLESGATTAKAGVLDNLPRIDYTGGTASLLLEPQRTNLITNSEYLVSINGGSVEYNSSISPEGLQNATKVIFGANVNDSATMNLSASCSGNTQYTWSAYVKNISGTGLFNIRIDTDTTTILVNQDITATSEWTRVSHTFTTDASATSFGSNSRYRSSADGNEILIWGAQLEEGSYPTSYIPTYGTSDTRVRDKMESDTSSFGITNEFTLFIDTNGALVDGTSLNVLDDLRWYTQSTNRYRFYKASDFTYISNLIEVNDRTKIALKITATECKTFVDGVLDSTISLPTSFASFDSIIRNMETKVKEELNQILLFPTALTDAECITLTT